MRFSTTSGSVAKGRRPKIVHQNIDRIGRKG